MLYKPRVQISAPSDQLDFFRSIHREKYLQSLGLLFPTMTYRFGCRECNHIRVNDDPNIRVTYLVEDDSTIQGH